MSEKVPYQKKNFIRKLKMPYHKTYQKTPNQKNIIKNFKKCLIVSKKDTLSQDLIKNLKTVPY